METKTRVNRYEVQIVRESILFDSKGEILPRTNVVPKYIPKEPVKACVARPSALPPHDITKLQRRYNSFNSANILNSETESEVSSITTRSSSTLNRSRKPRKKTSKHKHRASNLVRPVSVVGPLQNYRSEAELRKAVDWSSSDESETSEAGSVVTRLEGEVNEQKIKINSLENNLKEQLKVNGELKKLLVASVGDDLQYRVEKLARDKVELSTTVGSYSERLYQDVEDLDRISIQADMWRSKFFASRVQSEDISRKLEELTVKYQESLSALQHILDQRQTVHNNLITSHRLIESLCLSLQPSLISQFRQQIPFQNTTLTISEYLLHSITLLVKSCHSQLKSQPVSTSQSQSQDTTTNSAPRNLISPLGGSVRTIAENEAFHVLSSQDIPDTSSIQPPHPPNIPRNTLLQPGST